MADVASDPIFTQASPFLELADQLGDLTRALVDVDGEQPSIERLLHHAVAAVPAGEHAAVTLTRGSRAPETLSATGESARVFLQTEHDAGEGPGLRALTQSDPVRVIDLAATQEWPVFGPRAVRLAGVRSVLAFRLHLSHDHRGVLNFYSAGPDAFGDDAVATGAVFAAYTSLALTNRLLESKRMHLERALESNREIGMALGVLMARKLWTSEQAFDRLREVSQQLHRKLRDIAAEVLRTGELPPDGARRA